jgi:tryptophan synthase alpha chain
MKSRNGVQRIADLFAGARNEGRAALMPYLTLGYPTPEMSLTLVKAAVEGGADMLELGIPFSDPLADGPTIQRASSIALRQGMTVTRCLAMAHDLRRQGVEVPFTLMGYYNPILAYGEARFCRECRETGIDGLIVPDLPPEEGATLESACRQQGLALIYLIAPTSTPGRIRLLAERSQGFVYLVSVTGVTGARDSLAPGLADFVRRVRKATDKPLAVGFGISGPEQAAQVASLADGVIVGSAFIRAGGGPGAEEKVRILTTSLRQAMHRDCPRTTII